MSWEVGPRKERSGRFAGELGLQAGGRCAGKSGLTLKL